MPVFPQTRQGNSAGASRTGALQVPVSQGQDCCSVQAWAGATFAFYRREVRFYYHRNVFFTVGFSGQLRVVKSRYMRFLCVLSCRRHGLSAESPEGIVIVTSLLLWEQIAHLTLNSNLETGVQVCATHKQRYYRTDPKWSHVAFPPGPPHTCCAGSWCVPEDRNPLWPRNSVLFCAFSQIIEALSTVSKAFANRVVKEMAIL